MEFYFSFTQIRLALMFSAISSLLRTVANYLVVLVVIDRQSRICEIFSSQRWNSFKCWMKKSFDLSTKHIFSQPWYIKNNNWSQQPISFFQLTYEFITNKTSLFPAFCLFKIFFKDNILNLVTSKTSKSVSLLLMFHITIRVPSAPNLLSFMSVIVTCVFDLWDLRVSTVQVCYSSGVSCFMLVL